MHIQAFFTMEYWILLVDHTAKQFNRIEGRYVDIEAEAGSMFETLDTHSHCQLVHELKRSYGHRFEYTPLALSSIDVSHLYMLCMPTMVDLVDRHEMQLLTPLLHMQQRFELHNNGPLLLYIRNLQVGHTVSVRLNPVKCENARIEWIGCFDRPKPFQIAPPSGIHFGIQLERLVSDVLSSDGRMCGIAYFEPSNPYNTTLFVNASSIFRQTSPSRHYQTRRKHSDKETRSGNSQFYCYNERSMDFLDESVNVPSPSPQATVSKEWDDLPDLRDDSHRASTSACILEPVLVDTSDVAIGERVIWIDADGVEQYGTVKWTGVLPSPPHNKHVYVGVEFDNPVGGGTGHYQDKELFRAKRNHASLVPLIGLIREKDYYNKCTTSKRDSSGSNESDTSTKLAAGSADIQQSTAPKLIIKPQAHSTPKEQQQTVNVTVDFEIGSCVSVRLPGDVKRNGVVRWIGVLPLIDGKRQLVVGVETESMLPCAWPEKSDGTYLDGVRYFNCQHRYGLYAPYEYVHGDKRFRQEKKLNRFGSFDSGVLHEYTAPLSSPREVDVVGMKRGMQGHCNSCYLDATIYAMFSSNDSFDSLLKQDYGRDDVNELISVLATRIVYPLRRTHYVRADHIMLFRELLSKLLPNVQGLMDQEKDPEELILGLFNLLNVPPTVKYMCLSGQRSSEHICSLIMSDCATEANTVRIPTIQYLVERTLFYSNLRLIEAPHHLIIQLPRSGSDRLFDYIIPNVQIDIRHVLLNVSRPCGLCGEVALYECNECMLTTTQPLAKATFCLKCFNQYHFVDLPSGTNDHMPTPLTVTDCTVATPVLYDLYSCVCIESSHYVAYSRMGDTDKFVFTDSMADRVGEEGGYNIPEVKLVPDTSNWLSERGISKLLDMSRTELLNTVNPLLRRMLKDCYFCFYKKRRL